MTVHPTATDREYGIFQYTEIPGQIGLLSMSFVNAKDVQMIHAGIPVVPRPDEARVLPENQET